MEKDTERAPGPPAGRPESGPPRPTAAQARPAAPGQRAAPARADTWRSPLQAVLLRPVLVAVIFSVCVAASLVASFVRDPTFTAEARIVVGRTDVRSNAVPGVSGAYASLAEVYSRFVGSSSHQEITAEQLGVEVEEVKSLGTVDASPIPDNPIIRVIAKSNTEAGAVALAKAGTAALVELVSSTNDPTARADQLYRDYQTAEAAAAQAQGALDVAVRNRDQLVAARAPAGEIAAADTAVTSFRSAYSQAQLKADTASRLYQESLISKVDGDVLSVLSEARSQGSDRSQQAQFGLAVGVLIGGFVSVGIAWLLANWGVMMGVRARLKGVRPSSIPAPPPPRRAATPTGRPPSQPPPRPPAAAQEPPGNGAGNGRTEPGGVRTPGSTGSTSPPV